MSRPYLNSLESLRGIAAILVLLRHESLLFESNLDVELLWGALERGDFRIDVFFVLSGFFAVWTQRRGEQGWSAALGFLRKRLFRLLPLLWILTSCKLLLLSLVQTEGRHSGLDAFEILRSYTMVPAAGYPLILAAWTLSLELVFAIVWAWGLVMGASWKRGLFAIWVVAIGAVWMMDLGCPSEWKRYFLSPYMLEFLAGTWIASELANQRSGNFRPMLGLATSILGLVFLIAIEPLQLLENALLERVAWGSAIALMVYSLALRDLQSVTHIPTWWRAVCKSSYSIYLSHSLVIIAGLTVLKKLTDRSAWDPLAPMIACGLALSAVACGYLLNQGVEIPFGRWIRKRASRVSSGHS